MPAVLVWRALTADILSLIAANTVSGAAVVAMAYVAWRIRDKRVEAASRRALVRARSSHLQLLEAELNTIISFTEKCEMASTVLEQFGAYQQWLVANGLLSWKHNRLIVQGWQQTSGAALAIRLGPIAVPPDVIADLVSDMRKTEFPEPEDDHFRWKSSPGEPVSE